MITLKAEGSIGEGVTYPVATAKAMVETGLHPATGGLGFRACSGNMPLQALVACAGVTLNAMAPARRRGNDTLDVLCSPLRGKYEVFHEHPEHS